jgi:hypothetical protein
MVKRNKMMPPFPDGMELAMFGKYFIFLLLPILSRVNVHPTTTRLHLFPAMNW